MHHMRTHIVNLNSIMQTQLALAWAAGLSATLLASCILLWFWWARQADKKITKELVQETSSGGLKTITRGIPPGTLNTSSSASTHPPPLGSTQADISNDRSHQNGGTGGSPPAQQDTLDDAERALSEVNVIAARRLALHALRDIDAKTDAASSSDTNIGGWGAALLRPNATCVKRRRASSVLKTAERAIDAAVRALVEAREGESEFRVCRDDDLRVLYRHKSGDTMHYIKFEAVFDAPVHHVLSLLREFDLAITWNRFLHDSQILSAPSLSEVFVYALQWLPWPFKPICAFIRARGYDMSEWDDNTNIAPENLRQLTERMGGVGMFILVESGQEAELTGEQQAALPAKHRGCITADIYKGSFVSMVPSQGSDNRTMAAMYIKGASFFFIFFLSPCKPFLILFRMLTMTRKHFNSGPQAALTSRMARQLRFRHDGAVDVFSNAALAKDVPVKRRSTSTARRKAKEATKSGPSVCASHFKK